MLKNYFKIAVRNLLKNKVYSFINVFGLTLGFLCCMLIMLHVKDELSYDKFLPNHENIYRVALERIYPDHVSFYSIIPDSYSEVISKEVKGVEESTRLFSFGGANALEYGEVTFEERYLAAADSNFFNVFGFEILSGDPKTALSKPNTLAPVYNPGYGRQGPSGPITVGQQVAFVETAYGCWKLRVPGISFI